MGIPFGSWRHRCIVLWTKERIGYEISSEIGKDPKWYRGQLGQFEGVIPTPLFSLKSCRHNIRRHASKSRLTMGKEGTEELWDLCRGKTEHNYKSCSIRWPNLNKGLLRHCSGTDLYLITTNSRLLKTTFTVRPLCSHHPILLPRPDWFSDPVWPAAASLRANFNFRSMESEDAGLTPEQAAALTTIHILCSQERRRLSKRAVSIWRLVMARSESSRTSVASFIRLASIARCSCARTISASAARALARHLASLDSVITFLTTMRFPCSFCVCDVDQTCSIVLTLTERFA